MTDIARPQMSVALANLMCMASMVIWAAGLPAAQSLIDKLPLLPLSAARMALAALVLVPLWIMTEGFTPLRRANWPLGLLIGGGTIGLGAFLLILGQARTDPVTVAVISATMPVVGTAIEVILDGRRFTVALVAGLALSLIGGVVALDLSRAGLGFGWGALLCFSSVVLFTIGSRLTVTAFPEQTSLGRVAVTLAGSALVSVAAAAVHRMLGAPAADWGGLSATNWGALALFAIGGLAISQVLWINSVGRLGIALASLHINAAPFYVMLILFLMGEPWSWRQAAGAAIVGLGVLVAQNMIPPRRT